MAITYPVTIPVTKGFRSLSVEMEDIVAVTPSPYTGAQQAQAHQGQFWKSTVQLPSMYRADVEEYLAFLAMLRGRYGTFLLGDSMGKLPRGTDTIHSIPDDYIGPYVSGASQTGMTLTTAGWNNWANSFKKGDYFQLGGMNLLLRSEEFDNAAWTKSNVTVTANSVTSPDGTTTADTLSTAGSGDTYVMQTLSSADVSAGDAITFSIWLRVPSGTLNIDIAIGNDGLSYVSKTITLTSTWKRFYVTGSRLTNTFVILGRSNPLPFSSTIYASKAQVNIGADPDAYIVTSTTTVRRPVRLHKVTSEAYANGSGVTVLDIWPRLRESPPNGSYIKTRNARGTFRLAENSRGWSTDPYKIYSAGFTAVEAF